jgi:acetyltransferase-like isoleucine patch superfamily enzyme
MISRLLPRRDPLDARRDPRQAKFFTLASLRWIIRHRAYTPFYLIRYWRFFTWKARNPHIITEGFVFLGKNVELYARKGYGRLILGKWVHIGSGNALRAHEGTLRIGDKCVFGKDNTVNTYLDIEFGAATIVADWVYVCDFDHVFSNIHMPIKDQGITKSPVRIGPDCWLGTKVTILRGTRIGRGSVIAAHCLVNSDVPPYSVAVGVPVRVVRNRIDDARARAELEAQWARETAEWEARQRAARAAAEDESGSVDGTADTSARGAGPATATLTAAEVGAASSQPPADPVADHAAAAAAEAAARSAGITAPVDPSEQSDLPMAPAPTSSGDSGTRPHASGQDADAANNDRPFGTTDSGSGADASTGFPTGRAPARP